MKHYNHSNKYDFKFGVIYNIILVGESKNFEIVISKRYLHFLALLNNFPLFEMALGKYFV